MKKLLFAASLIAGPALAETNHRMISDTMAYKLADRGLISGEWCVTIAEDRQCYTTEDYPQYWPKESHKEVKTPKTTWYSFVESINFRISWAEDDKSKIPPPTVEDDKPTFTQTRQDAIINRIFELVEKAINKIPNHFEGGIEIDHGTTINQDGIDIEHRVEVTGTITKK